MVDDYPSALAAYDQAIALAPARARYWFNRAAVRRPRDQDSSVRRSTSDKVITGAVFMRFILLMRMKHRKSLKAPLFTRHYTSSCKSDQYLLVPP